MLGIPRVSLITSALCLVVMPAIGLAQDTKSGSSQQMHENMMKGMKDMPKMTGDIDHDFAMMMRHHHKQGVDMAQMELQNGKDPQMRAMAQKIMDSQKQEISDFDKWLSGRGAAHSGHK